MARELGKQDSLCVVISEKDDVELSIKRFCRKFKDSDVMRELLSRRFYRKPSEERRKSRMRNSSSEGRK
jgi:ribosomal protein S21